MTGASSGIGEAFVRALASMGTDVVAVARREDRLRRLADTLTQRNGVSVEVLTADLCAADGVGAVEERLLNVDKPVDLLVNNAGFGTTGPLAEADVEREEEQIRLNVTALVRLTRVLLPRLIADGRGGIVNVGSIAGFQPSPMNATYGATKAFVGSFTQAVAEEVRGTGVRIQLLAPGFTRTEFQDTADYEAAGRIPGFLWQTAAEVVGASLLALDRGKVVCVPGVYNKLAMMGTSITPPRVTRRVAGIVSRLR